MIFYHTELATFQDVSDISTDDLKLASISNLSISWAAHAKRGQMAGSLELKFLPLLIRDACLLLLSSSTWPVNLHEDIARGSFPPFRSFCCRAPAPDLGARLGMWTRRRPIKWDRQLAGCLPAGHGRGRFCKRRLRTSMKIFNDPQKGASAK